MNRLTYSIILFLIISAAIAQNLVGQAIDFGKENSQLSQKFKLAYYLLNHTRGIKSEELAENQKAARLIQIAQSNYQLAVTRANEENWVEANAIIASVIRDVTASSQLLSKKARSRNLYIENLKRVEAFILPEWTELSANDQELLRKTTDQINNLLELVKTQAVAKQYDKANTNLYEVYSLKTHLLQSLQHKDTIIYDLNFESSGEEYDYMLKRNQHYQLMVESVLKQNSFDEPTLNLVNVYLRQSRLAMNDARIKEADNKNKQAVQILQQSITNLSNALKLMGLRN